MEEVVQKVGEKSLNIKQDKKVLTSQKNEQAITHGQQKVELSLKEEIIKLREAVQETIKNPTNNEEFNKTSKEILGLINNINAHQPSRLQATRNKILSSGESPNTKNTKIEGFFLEQHEWDKFQELRERLQKIKEPREKLYEMKNFYDVINSLDKNIILGVMQEKQKVQQASNQKAQEIIRSKFLYLDNAWDFSDGLQNLFEKLKNKEATGEKELIEASKNILSKSISVNKNYYKLTDPREERRSDNIALEQDDTGMLTTDTDLEWDDTGILPPAQNSAVSDKLKEAVDDYISELQNEKLSKDTSPKQVEAITHPMQEAIPTPLALS
ncbi:hypothetical protein [Rickettsia parkeri]|uniref:hypothetical protein n=1 Tax=Rickettsia parkeri TaxID=35792 RepID=UPI0021C09398|nr:hypothetical protein [Rickettsia parkeri]